MASLRWASTYNAALSAVRNGLAEHVNPWYAVDLLKSGWLGADNLLLNLAKQQSAESDALAAFDHHHRYLDLTISSLKAFRGSWPGMYYGQGFGDPHIVANMLWRLQNMRNVGDASLSNEAAAPGLTDVHFTRSVHGRGFAAVHEGSYSPPGTWLDHLPSEAHKGRFQLITPTCWYGDREAKAGAGPGNQAADIAAEMSAIKPIMVLLAGTGEHGFRRRRHCVAYPLARLGIGTIIMEIPFYGARRPKGQMGSKLATLVDLPLQGAAVIEETRALVSWLASQPALPEEGTVLKDEDNASQSSKPSAQDLADQHSHDHSHGLSAEELPQRQGACTGDLPSGSEEATAAIAAHAAYVTNEYSQGSGPNETGGQHSQQHHPSNKANQAGGARVEPRDGDSSSGSSRGNGRDSASVRASEQHAASGASSGHRPGPAARGRPGGYGAIVLGGTSMGGLHAAMTACTLPSSLPVGIASWLGPPSAASVYTQGRLAYGVDWAALATHATHSQRGPALERGVEDVSCALSSLEWQGLRQGLPSPIPRTPSPPAEVTEALLAKFPDIDRKSLGKAQELSTQLLQATDLLNFGRPARPDAAVFVTAASDQYVPAHDASLAAMWDTVRHSWPGVEVRAVRGGHVSASLFSLDSFVSIVVEVVRRLRHGGQSTSATAGAGAQR